MDRMSMQPTMARRFPPGPPRPPILGHSFRYLRDPLGFLDECTREYGDIIRLRLAGRECYLLVRPEHIEQVFRRHGDGVVKDFMTRELTPIVGQGLLTSEGAFWRRQRRLAQPAFGREQVERYGAVMVDYAERMLDDWGQAVGAARDVHKEFSRLTLAIVGKTLFDADLAGATGDIGDALDVVMDYFLIPSRWVPGRRHLPLPSTLRMRRAVGRIDRVLYGIIHDRRRSGHDPGDLLSRLLAAQDVEENGGGMTDQQLRDEAVTLFLAGHETTALALAYVAYLLARTPTSSATSGRG